MTFSSFDFVMLIGMLFLAWRGFSRGIISQVAAVLGIGVGWIMAMRLSPLMAAKLPIGEPTNHYVALALLFCIGVVVVHFAAWFLQRIFHLVYLRWLDHVLGTILGIVKGVLICLTVTFVAVLISDKTAQWVTHSQIGGSCIVIISSMKQMMPPDVNEQIQRQLAKFTQKIEESDWTPPEWSQEINAEKMTTFFSAATPTESLINRAQELETKSMATLSSWFQESSQKSSSRLATPVEEVIEEMVTIPESSPTMLESFNRVAAQFSAPPKNSQANSPAPANNASRAFPAQNGNTSATSSNKENSTIFDPAAWARALAP